MSHQVETMAYTNEVPWHGLGTYIEKAPTVEKMLKLAKLDWEVERRDIFHLTHNGQDEVTKVDDFAALVRSSDNKVLDVVGSRYIPAQNKDVFAFFKEFVEAGSATLETAGSLKGGRYVWGLADLKTSFKLRGNDQVKGYLLVASPHEQGKSLVIKFTSVRVVCNNTLTLALGSGGTESSFRMTHRTKFDETMIERAKETLGIAREQLGEFERNAKTLQKLKLTREDAIRILAPVYQPGMEIKDLISDFDKWAAPKLKAVIDANDKAPGAQPDNGWGVINAVTYFSDHIASRSADARLTNAWMGRTARQKERVLNDLLNMAQ